MAYAMTLAISPPANDHCTERMTVASTSHTATAERQLSSAALRCASTTYVSARQIVAAVIGELAAVPSGVEADALTRVGHAYGGTAELRSRATLAPNTRTQR